MKKFFKKVLKVFRWKHFYLVVALLHILNILMFFAVGVMTPLLLGLMIATTVTTLLTWGLTWITEHLKGER